MHVAAMVAIEVLLQHQGAVPGDEEVVDTAVRVVENVLYDTDDLDIYNVLRRQRGNGKGIRRRGLGIDVIAAGDIASIGSMIGRATE